MAAAKKDKKSVAQSTTKTDSFLGPRLREGAFIGVSAACAYILMALMTYSASDPGWSATGTGNRIANLGAILVALYCA